MSVYEKTVDESDIEYAVVSAYIPLGRQLKRKRQCGVSMREVILSRRQLEENDRSVSEHKATGCGTIQAQYFRIWPILLAELLCLTEPSIEKTKCRSKNA
jgi:hypothetical protein